MESFSYSFDKMGFLLVIYAENTPAKSPELKSSPSGDTISRHPIDIIYESVCILSWVSDINYIIKAIFLDTWVTSERMGCQSCT